MKTKKYARLPPEAGIPFVGFEFAEIESRKPVAKDIQGFIDYCVRDARSPAARIILGEWGEGKSEAYIRYIAPTVKERGGFAYDVSAPSIIETYKTPVKNAKLKMTSATSVQFLTTVFWAILDELRAKGIVEHKIPSIYDFADPTEWLQEIFRSHAESRQLKLFIFIDQMEELNLEPDVLKWFLTGLRETLDGKFFPISERGPYPGSLFFFLSCTPDAYNKMRVDPHIDQIFGGQQRRIDTILLQPIGRVEGIRFFYDLLRYSYMDSLPHPLSFMSSGVLISLYTATRGNLGAMVSLFTWLMSRLPSYNSEVEVVGGQQITDWLSNKNISIYGGTTRCIEKELVNAVESMLQISKTPPVCLSIFKTMIGELKTFSVQEIAERFGLSVSEVYRHINVINQVLSNIVSNSIVRFYPLKEEATFADVIEKFRVLQWIDIDDSGEQIVHVENYTENVRELRDKLTFPEFDDVGNLIEKVFLPFEIETIEAFMEGVSKESALKIRKALERLLDERARYFVLSEIMVNRLYPIPVSPWLHFLKNRDLRLKLWRNVRANFHSYFQDNMSDAFIDLLGHTTSFQVSNRRDCSIKTARYVDVYEVNGKISIRAILFSKPYITVEELQEIAKETRKVIPRPNLILILHSEDLPEDVAQQTSRIDERILLLKLHPTYAKNLLAIFLAIRDYSEHVDKTQLSSVLKNLALQMEIDRRISAWIEEGRKSGVVLADLTKNFANDDKELVDALKFYVNFMGLKATPSEIYSLNGDRLLRFVPFGLRLGFAADIETEEQFKKITEDLIANGFVREASDGKIEVVFHPVEKRILNILAERKEVDVRFLEEYFVLSAAARKILSMVYLNALEHKGLIDFIGSRITLKNLEECQRQTEKKYKNYRSAVDMLLPMWKDYAHVYVLKQRAPRLILLKDLDKSIASFNDSIQLNPERETQLQIICLLDSLIDHFEENIRPKIEGAVQKSKEIVETIEAKFNEFDQKCSDLVTGYNTLRKSNLTLTDVREYSTVEKGKNEIIEFYSSELSDEGLQKASESVDKEQFDFHDYRRDDGLFNVKLSTIENMINNFTEDVDRKLAQLDSMNKILTNIRNKEADLESKIVTFQLKEKCLISSQLFATLQQLFLAKKEIGEELTMQERFKVKFLEIEKDLKQIESKLVDKELSLGSAIEALREIHSVEIDYLNKSKEIQANIDTFAANLDMEKYADIISALRQSIDRAQEHYSDLCESLNQHEIEVRSLRKVRKKLESVFDEVDEIQDKMEGVWKTYEDGLKERINSTFNMFMVLRERGQEIDEAELRGLTNRANDLREMVEKIRPWLGEIKISEIENELLKIIDEASKLLQRYLSAEEALVLQCVMDERKKLSKDWITTAELIKSIKAKREEVDVEEIVRRLIKKKILAQGISLHPG